MAMVLVQLVVQLPCCAQLLGQRACRIGGQEGSNNETESEDCRDWRLKTTMTSLSSIADSTACNVICGL
ncbi:hypothetical protein SLA2020_460980 [Shorea laevis]